VFSDADDRIAPAPAGSCGCRITRGNVPASVPTPAPRWLALVGAALVTLGLTSALAQPSATGIVENYTASDYYDAPHALQKKWHIAGEKGEPRGENRFQLTGVKLESFRENGEREILIEAPDCLYDAVRRTASSPGRLKVQSGDGRFLIEGEGFLWQQTNSVLTISNRVRSSVQRIATHAPGAEVKPPLVITSKRFDFDMPRREGVFRDDVEGRDAEMEFTCGIFTLTASTNSQSPELFLAETAVTWKRDQQVGRADRAVIHASEKSLEALGNVVLQLPRASGALGGFFSAAPNGPATGSQDAQPVVLYADHFHSRSNLTVAEGAVRVVDRTNRLTCDKLTLQSTADAPKDTTAVAEGHVEVAQGEQGRQLRSDRAVYTKADGVVVFTGKPEWTLDPSAGRANRVTVRSQTGEIHAEGNVAARVTLRPQQGSLLKLFPVGPDTNSAPQVIEVFARDLNAAEGLVTFLGDARAHQSPITGAEPRLRADSMEVRFATNAHQIASLQAKQNVIYEQGRAGVTNGADAYRRLTTRTLTARSDSATGELSDLLAEGGVEVEQSDGLARGGRATYAAKMDVLELLDRPTLETPQVIISEARTLAWDKAKNRFSATAPYKLKLKSVAVKQAQKVINP